MHVKLYIHACMICVNAYVCVSLYSAFMCAYAHVYCVCVCVFLSSCIRNLNDPTIKITSVETYFPK